MLKPFIYKVYICINIALATKAEFDSALADFNARLTTFEAGINSKIDSQVTSYLDRNGIWSGKNQELLNPLYSTTGVPFPEKGWRQFYGNVDAPAYVGTTNQTIDLKYGTNYVFDLFNEHVCKSNKSGMLYLVFRIESHSELPKNKRWRLTTNGTGYNGLVVDYGKGFGSWSTYKVKSGDSTRAAYEYSVPSLSEVMGSQLLASQEGADCYVYYPDSLSISASFFVSDGDDIWVRMWNQMIGGGDTSSYTNTITNISLCGMFIAAEQRPTFHVDIAKVY